MMNGPAPPQKEEGGLANRPQRSANPAQSPKSGNCQRGFVLEDPFDFFNFFGFGFEGISKPSDFKKSGGFNRRTASIAARLANIAKREQPITLRGLFYRAVSAGIYPDTSDQYYDQCGRIVLKLRREGVIQYDWIVDSTRRRLKPSSWSGLAEYAETVAACYRRDLWARQDAYLEFFVEKDAMAAVVEPVTAEYDVHLNIIRGSVSETFAYNIGSEWKDILKPIYAYYLGDHDPAGLAIEDNLRVKLERFAPSAFIEWERIAVTAEQFFSRDDLLGFPVKTTVQRKTREDYIARFGNRCVEIDALPATEIRDLVRETIEGHIDQDEWSKLQETERLEQQSIRELRLAPILNSNGKRRGRR